MIIRFFTNESAFFFGLGLFILVSITFIEYDSDSSSDRKINDKNIQLRIKSEEFRFRDLMAQEFNAFIKDSAFKNIDSINKINIDAKPIKEFLLLKFFDDLKDKTISIESGKPSFLSTISWDSVRTTFKIKKENLRPFTATANFSNQAFDYIKYGDIIETNTTISRKIKFDIIALYLAGIIISKLIVDFTIANIKKRKPPLTELSSQQTKVEKAIKKIAEKEPKSEALVSLETDLQELRKHIDQILSNPNSIDDTKIEAIKSERISKQFYDRSNLLLTIAFIIAIAGIVIFYVILPEFKEGISLNNYLAISLRPIFILIFFQSLSFFIFKQYRTSVNDYKFFNKEYQDKINFIIAYKLIKKEEFNEKEINSLTKIMRSKKLLLEKDDDKDSQLISLEQLKNLIKQ